VEEPGTKEELVNSERCRNGMNSITIDRPRNFIKKQRRNKRGGGLKKPQQNYVGTKMKI